MGAIDGQDAITRPRHGCRIRVRAALAIVLGLTTIAAIGCTRDPDVRVDPPMRSGPLEIDDVRLVRANDCEQLVSIAEEREQTSRELEERWRRSLDEGSAGRLLEDQAVSAEGEGDGDASTSGVDASAALTTVAPMPSAAAADSAAGTGSASVDKATTPSGTVIAGTNNQESAVDEGDMVKTDGRRLVVLSGDGVLRVVLLDDSPTVDGSASIGADGQIAGGGGGAGGSQLLLRGDEAVAVVPSWSPSSSVPVVTISRVDLSDASAPRVLEQSRVAGELVATRMISGGTAGGGQAGSSGSSTGAETDAADSSVVRIVIRPVLGGRIEPVPMPTDPVPTEPGPTTTEPGPTTTEPGPSTTFPTRTTEPSTPPSTEPTDIPTAAAAMLPQRLDTRGEASPLGTCSDVLSVPPSATAGTIGAGMTGDMAVDSAADYGYGPSSGMTVLTVGATLGDLAPVTIEGGAETVYATTDALYATTTAWGDQGAATAVHRFDLTAAGAARYTGSGLVPGSMLDQYSLSDRGGALRVVTTSTTMGSASGADGTVAVDLPAGIAEGEPVGRTAELPNPVSAGRLTVLRPDDSGTLREVGHLDGLGLDEQVKAVRFIEDRAYVVTFRQTDPLFAIDLSDDTAPRLLGELKMPGFSEYLHPLGDGRLLGIGSDADPQTGRVTGFKASLFDVSDPTAPKELDSIVEADRQSLVSNDPHAFTWDPVRKQAIVPVSTTSFGMDDCPPGAMCAAIEEPVPPTTVPCPPDASCTSVSPERVAPVRRWAGADVIAVDGDRLVLRGTLEQDLGGVTPDLLRSVIVDSTIWTISDIAVGAHSADSLDTTATVRF